MRPCRAADALELAPNAAAGHTVLGWQRLRADARDQAITSFQEALRLDPSSMSARAGLLEAMRAGNPVYAVARRVLLWNTRLLMKLQARPLMGAIVVVQVIAINRPATRPVLVPLIVYEGLWVISLMLVRPLANGVLRSSADGRRLLTRDESRESVAVTWAMIASVVLVASWPLMSRPPFAFAGVSVVLLATYIPHVFSAEGRQRTALAVAGAAALLAMTAGLVITLAGGPVNGDGLPRGAPALMMGAPIMLALYTRLFKNRARRAPLTLPRLGRRRSPDGL